MGVNSPTPIENPTPPTESTEPVEAIRPGQAEPRESKAPAAAGGVGERRSEARDSKRGLWLSCLAYLVSLFVPAVLELISDVPWFIVVGLSASVGALALWNLNIRYEQLLKNRSMWNRNTWLRRQIPFAIGGVLVATFGAVLLRVGSATNSDWQVAVALGVVIGGLMIVIRVVEVDLGKVVGTDEHFPQKFSAAPESLRGSFPAAAAWGLNVGLIGGATMLSIGVVAFSIRGFAIGLAIVLLWSTAVWAGRSRATSKWTWTGFGLITAPPAALYAMVVIGQEISGVALYVSVVAMLVGLVIVSARQRSLWPEQDQDKSEEAPLALGDLDRRDALLAIGGAVSLVIGIVWWWIEVAGPGVAWLLPVAGAFVIFLFGVSLVTRGEGFLAIALLGFALVWAVDGHTVGPQPAVEVDSGQPVMVAFGDSYMSGEGIGRFYDNTNTADSRDYGVGGTNDCRRSPDAYTPLLAGQLGFALSFDACSGAKAMSNELAEAILPTNAAPTLLEELDLSESSLVAYMAAASESGEAGKNSIIGQLLRWRELPPAGQPEPDLVLLSLGGNDAGFSGIGQACFLPGSCQDALNARSDDVFGGVSIRTAIALAVVAKDFPDAQLAVVAYPQMFGAATSDCAGQVPFEGTEVSKLAETVDDLNAAVFAGVGRVQEVAGDRVSFRSATSEAFDGHRFCEDPADRVADDAVVNTIYLQAVDGPDLLARIIPGKLIHNTFHPTTRGHELLADALCSDVSELREVVTGTAVGDSCTPAGDVEVTEEPDGLMAMPATGDEVEDGVCNDFDKYVYCSVVGWVQRVAIPVLLLVVGGASAARWVDRNNLLLKLLATLRKNRLFAKLVKIIPIGG